MTSVGEILFPFGKNYSYNCHKDFKDEAMGKTQVYEWFIRCKRGENSVEDHLRCGHLP
jgi:hypothetical protein